MTPHASHLQLLRPNHPHLEALIAQLIVSASWVFASEPWTVAGLRRSGS